MVIASVAIVFVVFAVLILKRPATIIAMAFSMYAFEQWAQANSAFFGVHASYINLGFGLLTLWALAVVTVKDGFTLNPTTHAMWCWLALYVYAGVSVLWAVDRSLSIFLFKYNAPYFIAFVVLLPLVIRKPTDMYRSLIATLIFGTVVMLLLFLGTRLHAWGRTIEAASGAIRNRVGELETRLGPLAIAEMAGHLLMISLLMNFKGIDKIWRLLRYGVAVLALILIYRSESRGQLIGALLVVLCAMPFSRGTKRAVGWVTASVSAAFVVGIAGWMFVGMATRPGRWDLTNMQSDFAGTRMEYVSTLLSYWATSSPLSWLFGIGSSSSYDPRVLGRYCHVVVVEALAELGLVGFCLLITFTLLVYRDLFRMYALTKNDDVDRGIAVTLGAIFSYGVLLSFKQGSILTHCFTFSCGLMLSRHSALVQAAYRREKAKSLYQQWYSYYAWWTQQSMSPTSSPPQA